ncbi:MAG: c-type cytochrome [Casimicrobium sp.]
MKTLIHIAIASFAASFASLAHADEALAKKHACTACHGVADRIVGPSFQEIAAKRAGEKDAQAKLIASILKGGTGQYGKIPMPEQSHVPEADVKTLATWVLSLKK